MKRILVICDPLAPPGFSPRVRYLCDYLVQTNYSVTLLTEQDLPLEFEHAYPIVTIRMYSGGLFDWFVKTIWTLLTDWHNRAFTQRGLAVLKDQYDLVFCTVFSDFPLGAGQRIAQALNIPLICDIRDLDEQVDNSKYQYKHKSRLLMPFRRIYRAIHLRRRNKVLQAANTITTVSPWHADFIRQFNPNVHVVYNGYDAELFYPEDIPTEQFVISYIGSLFEWQQPSLSKVRQAIQELNNTQIKLQVHTSQQNPIEYDQMGDAIRNSSIMLVLTAPHTHGMLTTKFYEALGCEKPVLCVPSDNGSLAELIAYTNAGIATDDIEQIKQFITAQYNTWLQNGFTHQQTQHREEFSRAYQTQKIEQLIKCL